MLFGLSKKNERVFEGRSWQTFSIKGQRVNILGLVGYMQTLLQPLSSVIVAEKQP